MDQPVKWHRAVLFADIEDDDVVGVGALLALAAALGVLGCISGGLNVAVAAILIVQGVFLVQGRTSFANVANTDEADQRHLADAVDKVRRFFLVDVIAASLFLLNGLVGIGTTFATPSLQDDLYQGIGSPYGSSGSGGSW